MVSINLFKVVANVGNPPLCSGVIAVPSGPKSNTFTVILAVFAPQPRLHHKGLICLFSFNSALYSTKVGYNTLICFCNKINWNRGKLKLRKSIIWIYEKRPTVKKRFAEPAGNKNTFVASIRFKSRSYVIIDCACPVLCDLWGVTKSHFIYITPKSRTRCLF